VSLEEPRRYIGASFWNRLTYEPGKPVRHVHACPGCYQQFQCEQDCTLEPDLELRDGTPCGAHCYCSPLCAADGDPYLADYYEPPSEPPEVPREQLAFDFSSCVKPKG